MIKAKTKKKEKRIIRHLLKFPNQSGFGFCSVVGDKIQFVDHGVPVAAGELLTVLNRFELRNDSYGTRYAKRWHASIVTSATRLFKLKLPNSPHPIDDFAEAEAELEGTGKIAGYLVLTSVNPRLIWVSEYDYNLLLAFPLGN